VNAAFLLVSSALLIGQAGGAVDKDKKAPTPTPTPTPAVVSSGCCQDSCCGDGFGHRLRDRLRGLFNRNNCDCCQPTTCCHRAPVARGCDDCRTRAHGHNHCASSCDSCDRGNFLGRLRERFRRGDSCCDGGCGTSCGSAPAKTGEKIDNPKKMPDPGKDKDKRPQEVRFQNQGNPNVIQVTPTVPSVEITPVPAPRVEGDRRDPGF
jgi:hypothetical protein